MKPSPDVVALGRKLIEILNVEERDLLARWMAHDIAEKIKTAEEASGAAAAKARAACADAILRLWSHRAILPNGKRPFEDLEPVLRTLEALDPEQSRDFYRQFPAPTPGEDPWLTAARDVDRAARDMIAFCLDKAEAEAKAEGREWVALARASGEPAAPDIELIRMLIFGDERRRVQEGAHRRRRIRGRLALISAWRKAAAKVSAELRENLAASETRRVEEADEASTDDL